MQSSDAPWTKMEDLIKNLATLTAELQERDEMGVNCVIFFATFPGYPPLKMLLT
jgi:hypothetical protein